MKIIKHFTNGSLHCDLHQNPHSGSHTHTTKHTPLPCYPKQTLLYLNSNWTTLELFTPPLQLEGGQLEKLSCSSIAPGSAMRTSTTKLKQKQTTLQR